MSSLLNLSAMIVHNYLSAMIVNLMIYYKFNVFEMREKNCATLVISPTAQIAQVVRRLLLVLEVWG